MRILRPISGSNFILPICILALLTVWDPASTFSPVVESDVAARPGIRISYLAPGEKIPENKSFTVLPGDGKGAITAIPAFLEPSVKVQVDTIAGRTPQFPFQGEIACSGVGPLGVRAGIRFFVLRGDKGESLTPADSHTEVRSGGVRALNKAAFRLEDSGLKISAVFDNMRTGTFHTQLDPGNYKGAEVRFMSGTFIYTASPSPFFGNSTWHGLATDGAYRITWRAMEDGLTLEVYDETRGRAVPFSPYIDTGGWGFELPGTGPEIFNVEYGVEWRGQTNVISSRDQRPHKLQERLSAGNKEEFHLYLDGQHWRFTRQGGLEMPRENEVMRLITAYGEWNEARTEFTQYPPPVSLQDKWRLELSADALKPAPGSESGAAGYTLSGILFDNNRPLSCVTVHLSGQGITDIRTTGRDGIYVFDRLASGSYVLDVFKTGFAFQPPTQTIDLKADTKIEPISGSHLVDHRFVGDTLTVGGILLAAVPGGAFRMGQQGAAVPLHRVALEPFRIGVFEITQAQYEKVMGKNPAAFPVGANNPVEQVSWFEAVRFCNELSRLAGREACYDTSSWSCDFTREGFCLPTEAEWEYACRAGSSTNFFTGCDRYDLGGVGWYGEDFNQGGKTHPAGLKSPNSWGVYDTHGNVWEWCNDWYGPYRPDSLHCPPGPMQGDARVIRGGAWDSQDSECRSATRESLSPELFNANVGFRVVLRK